MLQTGDNDTIHIYKDIDFSSLILCSNVKMKCASFSVFCILEMNCQM